MCKGVKGCVQYLETEDNNDYLTRIKYAVYTVKDEIHISNGRDNNPSDDSLLITEDGHYSGFTNRKDDVSLTNNLIK
jgi:hypothetical protein